MNVGAFAVVSHFAWTAERYVTLDDYAGLGKRSPLLAFTLTIFVLSLIGIPATAGFLAKYYVFTAALTSQTHSGALIGLTVIGLINSAVASYYYLRLIVVMYMREPTLEEAPAPASPAMRLALVIAAIATIYLGVMPGRVVNYADRGAAILNPKSEAGLTITFTDRPASRPTPAKQLRH